MHSVYIHIPFCRNICPYCDFAKLYYEEQLASAYLIILNEEITQGYQKEAIKTLYIGGGTPSVLTKEHFQQLQMVLSQFYLAEDVEFTFESNVEDITEENLQAWVSLGVNRLSIGVQSFHKKWLTKLDRLYPKKEIIEKIKLAKQYIPNINIDLMYDFETQRLWDIKRDLRTFFKLEIPHISYYALIIEPHTKFFIEGISNNEEEMSEKIYYYIKKKMKQKGYRHYEISNFALPGCQSKHNLCYWDNDHYYGFGLGASGYIGSIRYTNTRSIKHYLKKQWQLEANVLSKQEDMENYMILGLRKRIGVSKEVFHKRYGVSLTQQFDIDPLIKQGLLIDTGTHLLIPDKHLFHSNDILIHFIHDKKEDL